MELSGEGGVLHRLRREGSRSGGCTAARDKNSETDALSRGTDALGYGTAVGKELDCYTADGEDNGLSQKWELRNQIWREDK